jgi:hypothetical protein
MKEKKSQLDFYTMESGKVLYNLMKLDTYINIAAPYIRKMFSDNKNTCNLFKMGAKTNSGMDFLRKPSNGLAHIRLEMFNQCLFGRFTSNIDMKYEIKEMDNDEYGVIANDKIVLATEDVMSFKSLNFFFSLKWEDNKPVSVRIWYWEKVRNLIDSEYNEACLKNKKYCTFTPEYQDFPIDGNAKKYFKKEIESFFVDWRVFGRNRKKVKIDIFKDGKFFETLHFDNLKDFREKYNIWGESTLSQLINGKINETRVKIIKGERILLKRLNKNSLSMEINSEKESYNNTLKSNSLKSNSLEDNNPPNDVINIVLDLNVCNNTFPLKDALLLKNVLLQTFKSEAICNETKKINNPLLETYNLKAN